MRINRLEDIEVWKESSKNRQTGTVPAGRQEQANRQTKRSFTLIELMLVVVIIGVLAAMVMPRLVGRSEQARITAAKADINANIALALDMFEMDIGHYPDRLDDLRKDPGLGDKWKGPYLKKDPKDPWGRDYLYERLSGEDRDYKLCSKGPNETNPEDDICNE